MTSDAGQQKGKQMDSIIPYSCIFIDGDWRTFSSAAWKCFSCQSNNEKVVMDLQKKWTNVNNTNSVLPCLSVRSGLDLYLKVMNFEAGSEVIMSAINIPDMVKVVKHHNLKVVPWDISIETTEPKLDLLPSLITSRTVAILVAHIFGKWCDMNPIIDVAQSYNLPVIEDCAESFCGFDVIGNPRSDLVLFSFGVIKFSTAFGGAIAKIKDESVYKKMLEVYGTYRVQGHGEFLKKIFKYFLVYLILLPFSEKILISAARFFGIDHKAMAVQMLRGFPDQMTQRIKMRPSSALLQMLRERLEGFSKLDFETGQVKGDYVRMRLPEEAQMVGMKAIINNYWLFPILVESPDTVLSVLNALGVDAYRGATQLNIIEPETMPDSDDPMTPIDPSYPSEARYLIDHVVYLPVNKKVPFHVLNKICNAVKEAIRLSKDSPKVRIQSKL